MNFFKYLIFALAAGLIVYFVVVAVRSRSAENPDTNGQATTTPDGVVVADVMNSTFRLPDFDNALVTVVNGTGSFTTGGPVGGSVIIAQDFETMVSDTHVATILSINSGGSGTFVYLALFDVEDSVKLLDMEMLGDRVEVRSITQSGSRFVFAKTLKVNILDREDDEPMGAAPTIAKTYEFGIDEQELVLLGDEVSALIQSKSNLIVVNNPQPYTTIESPLTISGRARGTWFFEATAPVSLVNWDGLIIAEGIITATDNWMTENFVNFTGTLTFNGNGQVYNNATLIIHKDNPSGLPQNDNAIEIPVRL